MTYCIDLDAKCPEVLEFPEEEISLDLKFFNKSNALELSDFDRKVFRTEQAAEIYLERYNEALKRLRRDFKGRLLHAPCMLLKQRYLAQVLLGEKCTTWRDYRKDWHDGQIFQFHDQVHFVPVRLKSITRSKEYGGTWRYDYQVT